MRRDYDGTNCVPLSINNALEYYGIPDSYEHIKNQLETTFASFAKSRRIIEDYFLIQECVTFCLPEIFAKYLQGDCVAIIYYDWGADKMHMEMMYMENGTIYTSFDPILDHTSPALRKLNESKENLRIWDPNQLTKYKLYHCWFVKGVKNQTIVKLAENNDTKSK